MGRLTICVLRRRMGTELIVGCATDAFNIRKGIYATQSFEQRRAALERCGLVDRVIAEESWKQKRTDIINYNVCVLAVEDAWMGHFDDLRDIADVVYLSDVTEAGTQQGVVKAAFSQSA